MRTQILMKGKCVPRSLHFLYFHEHARDNDFIFKQTLRSACGNQHLTQMHPFRIYTSFFYKVSCFAQSLKKLNTRSPNTQYAGCDMGRAILYISGLELHGGHGRDALPTGRDALPTGRRCPSNWPSMPFKNVGFSRP